MTTGRITALAVLLLAFGLSLAQGEDTPQAGNVSLRCYGEPGADALEKLARALGAELEVADDETAGALTRPCWFALEAAEPRRALEVAERACGVGLALKDKRLQAALDESLLPPGETLVKGYNVSAHCARFVEYVNLYGPLGDDREREQPSPAERLASLVGEVTAASVSAVGDRLLVSGDSTTQAQVKELLSQIASEGVAPGGDHAAHKALIAALGAATPKAEGGEAPVSSLIAQMCAAAKVSFFISPAILDIWSDGHVTYERREGDTCLSILKRALPAEIGIECWAGALRFHVAREKDGVSESPLGACTVIDTTELLKRLEQSYRAQNTQRGRAQGFTGALSARGGIEVVAKALRQHQPGDQATILSFGSRLVVIGTYDHVRQSLDVLKELGWEDPAEKQE